MSLRRALLLSYVEKYGSYLIGLVSTMVISRLLEPKDIGVFAVGMAIVGIVAVVREFGVATYVVQERDLSPERVRAAFAVTLLLGVFLSLIVLLSSVPAGLFYRDPRVTSVIAVLALSFAITPLGSISQALLSRELRFGALTWIRLLYSLVLAVVACSLAATGFGPISLAWATVAAASTNAVVSFAVRRHPLRLNLHLADLKRVFAIGGPSTVIGIVDDIAAAVPELLLGRIQGLAAAGLLSRARGLSQMAYQLLARAAGPVFFAAFSALRRDGIAPAPLYLKATASITTIGWVFLGALAVLATPSVYVLLGSTWLPVAPLVRWLCLAAALGLITSGAHHLLLASGGATDVMWAKVWSLPAHVGCLTFGAFFGVEAMAAATVISTAVSGLLLALAVKRRLGIGLRAQMSPARLSLPIGMAGVAGCAPALLMPVSTVSQCILSLCVGGAGGAVLSVATLMTSPHPLRDEVRTLWQRLRRQSC